MYRVALGDGRVFVYNDADDRDVRAGRMISDFSRIVPVPGSGVDFERFAAVDVPQGEPVFLMITRLLREKGVIEFIEAARFLRTLHPSAKFRILGPLDPSPLAVSRR